MRSFRTISILALSFLLIGGAVGWFRPQSASPELSTPVLALARLEPLAGRVLYFTSAAAPFLKEHGIGDAVALASQFDKVACNAKAWRTLERERRFSALMLTGDPAAFRNLLDHLRKSPDWTLTWLDHTSLVFERSPARAWTAADLDSLKTTFSKHSRAERVTMRVQAAHRLVASGETAPARLLLDEAIGLDKHSAPAWAELACIQAACGQWDLVMASAERALACDARYLPAVAAKASALYAFGKFNDALTLTRKLIKATPEDGLAIELQARVAHAAHAFHEEIQALEKLVSLTRAQGAPTGVWRVYLAQAYAADIQNDEALQQFEQALREPDLPDSEKSFARKGIERIKSRAAVF